MKSILLGCLMTIIGILALLSVLTVVSKKMRAKEEFTALECAVESAVKNAMEQNSHVINSNEQFIDEFIKQLLLQIDDDSSIDIDIAAADYKKGLLSVSVKQSFKTPNGTPSSIEYQTTCLMEQIIPKSYYHIVFRDKDNNIYKEYYLKEGEKIIVPSAPLSDNEQFLYWRSDTIKHITDFGNATGDITYYPVYLRRDDPRL